MTAEPSATWRRCAVGDERIAGERCGAEEMRQGGAQTLAAHLFLNAVRRAAKNSAAPLDHADAMLWGSCGSYSDHDAAAFKEGPGFGA